MSLVIFPPAVMSSGFLFSDPSICVSTLSSSSCGVELLLCYCSCIINSIHLKDAFNSKVRVSYLSIALIESNMCFESVSDKYVEEEERVSIILGSQLM